MHRMKGVWGLLMGRVEAGQGAIVNDTKGVNGIVHSVKEMTARKL